MENAPKARASQISDNYSLARSSGAGLRMGKRALRQRVPAHEIPHIGIDRGAGCAIVMVLVGNLHVVYGETVRLKQVAGAAGLGEGKGRIAVSDVDGDGSLALGFGNNPVVVR